MTEQSNAELIAEANKLLAENQWTSGWGVESLAERLAAALEAADQRAELAEANLSVEESKNAGYRAKNNQLAAVVEKVRDAIEGERGWSRHRAGRVLDILDTAPADTLREVKAEAWSGGYSAGYSDRSTHGETFTRNPYKAREEQP